MDIKASLIGQYKAGLSMLKNCIEICPDELYTGGEHPRNFWRIAYHALFYTHYYLNQDIDDHTHWEKERQSCAELWADENAPILEPYTKDELLSYLNWMAEWVENQVNSLDLEREDTGIPWYKNMTKLEHQILNIRHLQGHVGQLSELLMAQGHEPEWHSRWKD